MATDVGLIAPFIEKSKAVLKCASSNPKIEKLYKNATGGFGYNMNLGQVDFSNWPNVKMVVMRLAKFPTTSRTIVLERRGPHFAALVGRSGAAIHREFLYPRPAGSFDRTRSRISATAAAWPTSLISMATWSREPKNSSPRPLAGTRRPTTLRQQMRLAISATAASMRIEPD